MKLPQHKTKIVCTIGPGSRSLPVIEGLVRNGMNVARLNLSHGDFEEHRKDIKNIRLAAAKLRRPVSMIIDLPGVKMRIGKIENNSIVLKKGDPLTLTTKKVLGTKLLISVSYKRLPESVSKGSIIFLNDGFTQLKVERVSRGNIYCRVIIGGTIMSNKGLNVPGAKLFIDPITKRDFQIIEWGLQQGVTTFGLSFIERAHDLRRVREFAKSKRKPIYLVAKIERKAAIDNFDEILEEADAVMIARGDLGIETPIEHVPVVQKELIRKAKLKGRPVITATQMLGSMTQNIRPTRAEVNDVANAIMDGTDAVMLSEETAIGQYPMDAVGMMVKIATSTEALYHQGGSPNDICKIIESKKSTWTVVDAISLNAAEMVRNLKIKYILSQTSSGSTARNISRFKPDCWILAFSTKKAACDFLVFSYGVYPFLGSRNNRPEALLSRIRKVRLVKRGETVMFTERRFSSHPGDTDSLGLLTL